MVDKVNFHQIPNLLGDPSKAVSYGMLKDISEIEASGDYRPEKNPREYYDQREKARGDRSSAEIRLHEAVEDIYGPDPKPHPLENDKDFDALLDTLFPEKPQEKIELPIVALPKLYELSAPQPIPEQVAVQADEAVQIQETIPPEEKQIISFETAKKILGPYIDTHQGKVRVEDFETAYKFFIELGSSDLEQSYLKEKRDLEKKQPNPMLNLKNLQLKLRDLSEKIEKKSEDSEILSKALRKQGFTVKNVEALADTMEVIDEVTQQTISKEKPFSDNFARIFFFLKAIAPNEMPDGIVFETLAKPLFEMIASRSSTDLKKPKRPDPQRITNTNSLKQKQRVFPGQLKKFETALAKSIPETYRFIVSKLGGVAPEVVDQRLKELNS